MYTTKARKGQQVKPKFWANDTGQVILAHASDGLACCGALLALCGERGWFPGDGLVEQRRLLALLRPRRLHRRPLLLPPGMERFGLHACRRVSVAMFWARHVRGGRVRVCIWMDRRRVRHARRMRIQLLRPRRVPRWHMFVFRYSPRR